MPHRPFRIAGLVSAAAAVLFAGHSTALVRQDGLPWSLSDYPAGGKSMIEAVAAPLTAQGSLLPQTCAALESGSIQQIASGVSGIGVAIARSSNENASVIVDWLPQCCQVLTSAGVDATITLGAAIALETREMAENDLAAAQEIEFVVGICDDDILERAYTIARGQDNLGELIAQEDGGSNQPADPLPPDTTGSGGVPSPG